MKLRFLLKHFALGAVLIASAQGLRAQTITTVTCGNPPVNETYCYTDNDSHNWHWQSSDGSSALSILFSAGTIESANYDHIRIYNGPNNTSPLLFEHTITSQENLTGYQFTASSGDLYMEMSSDVSSSCSTGGQTQWAWQVGCLDCTPPVATFTVNTDCDAQNFTIDVDVTVLGSDPTLDITNDAGAPTVTATAIGVYTVGPFPITTEVNLTLTNDANSLCSLHSPTLTNPLCATNVTCGDAPLVNTYCYGNNQVHAWHWHNTTPGTPLSMVFTAGFVDYYGIGYGDHLIIRDGADGSAPILFEPTIYNSYDLTGLQVISTGTDLYMELTTDGYGSCQDYGYQAWAWTVGCYDCTPGAATYSVVTDCDAQTFNVMVDLTDLGSDPSVELTNDFNATSVTASAPGTYTVGPFPITTLVTVTAQNDNSLCNIHSPVLTNPLCASQIVCGDPPVDLTYCYTNYDNHTWHWQSSTGSALSILFSAGTIESANYDHLRIYNGPDNTAPLLFEHTITQQENIAGYQFTASSGDIYMEMSSDVSSSCSSSSQTEWAWQVGCLDCTPPQATFAVNTDCDAQNFTIDVNVSVLGSDTTLDITNNAGAATVTATATGVYTVGPFPITTEVDLTLVNDTNSLCSLHSPTLTNPLCPSFVVCGEQPLANTYCYGDNQVHAWHWHNTTPGMPLSMIFTAGFVDYYGIGYGDHLVIYDGPDNSSSSPILFEPPIYNSYDLTGLQVTSTGTDIYMEITSDNYGSCQSYGYEEWAWTIGCYDCTPPEASYSINTDCIAQTYSVDVHVTVLGSDTTLDITNNYDPAMTTTATDTGVWTVGPFPVATEVTLTLTNDTNSLCTVHSPVLVNPLCPTDIDCGDAPLALTYCYNNNQVHAWHWHNTTPGTPLSMIFTAGFVDYYGIGYGDHLVIYDGPDNSSSSPILFEPPIYNSFDLTGLQVISTGTDIYMEITSDGYGSCSDYGYQAWAWTVGCYDCTPPTATYTVVTDCDAMQYSVDVNISVLGSDAVVDITNDNGAAAVPASATGTYTVGPFTAGTHTTVTLVNDVNGFCSVHSGSLVNPLCPTILACGADPVTETYCYTDYDSHTWHWQCACGSPIALQFSEGTIESNTYDHLTIYDGPDNNSPILFEHGYGLEDLAGLLVISTSSDIYMEMSSDGSGSCADGYSGSLWTWTVGCLDCTNPEATFSVVPDCQHATYQVAVNVGSTGSSSTVRIASTASADTLENVPAGITLVGPIPMDSVSNLTVMNATNGLCRVFSPDETAPFADCIQSISGAENFTYCYTNTDTSYFAYTCTSGLPVAITFQAGQLLVNDYVQIYDSAGVSDNVLLFQGNYSGQMAGHSFNSTNPQHALVMRVVSDGTYSCASGDASVALNWTVDCGYAGIEEETAGSFTMYPNPATSELYMRLPSDTHGTTEIRILDVSGRVAYSKSFTAAGAETNTFDLHGLQSGNYSVVVTTPNWVKAQNLQIIR